MIINFVTAVRLDRTERLATFVLENSRNDEIRIPWKKSKSKSVLNGNLSMSSQSEDLPR